MEIVGKAIAALPVKSGVSQRTGEQWQSREYVIETQEQFPKKMCFEVFGTDKLKEFNIRNNDLIKVHFDITAREYNGKWYNSIRAWKVEHVNQDGSVAGATANQVAASSPQAQAPQATASQVAYTTKQESDDDLPF